MHVVATVSFAMVLTAALVSPTANAAVLIVSTSAPGAFPTIQSAVDAASDGDTIVVRPGFYLGCEIVDKALTVAMEIPPSASNLIVGRIAIRNLAAHKTVVLNQMKVNQSQPSGSFDEAGAGLFIDHCAGAVRVQAATFGAAKGTATHVNGYPAILVIDSPNVELLRVTATGGVGYGVSCADDFSIDGFPGGQALRFSGSHIVAHECIFTGGKGGDVCLYAGDGGAAVLDVTGYALLSGCVVTGGQGGNADDFFGPQGLIPGDGGPALHVVGGQVVDIIGSSLAGGQGGHTIFGSSGGFGAQGPISVGSGSVNVTPFPARALSVTPVAKDNASTTVLLGVPGGESVFLFLSAQGGTLVPGPQLVPLALGTLIGPVDLGVMPPGGSQAIVIGNPGLPPGVDGIGIHLQAVTSGPTGYALTGPAHLLLLSAAL
jgi:hypothetical protein